METGSVASARLRALLNEMIERGASDLHLTAGGRPKLRIDGRLTDCVDEGVLGPDDTEALGGSLLTDSQRKRFARDADLDLSFSVAKLSRFRVNLFRQRGNVACAIRRIPVEIRTLRELGIPPVVTRLTRKPRGLVLVTGPTGSGKSTTLAAMVDRINTERAGHIVTIEDPIEFVHSHKRCIVNQREVGYDTRSFAHALKYALRQDPDVILIGEMRDPETIQAALTVAETGHLALATLHTYSAAESINRIIDAFPSHRQEQIRAQFALVFEAVITQTLLRRAGGKGRVVACEVLVATPATRALIREEKVHQIYSAMQAARKFGMQTLNDSLYRLYVRRSADFEECLRVSSDPADFRRMTGTSLTAGAVQ
ncbi:type IV pilus twitching motility protein PilT [Candidatus Palauibacter sp.]|uniref:type IV pilus twitching motility protein PilT n=1 Tax=Candidatus Palauibacter sp. TaxID=3101350 RepID=UPI003B5BE9E3